MTCSVVRDASKNREDRGLVDYCSTLLGQRCPGRMGIHPVYNARLASRYTSYAAGVIRHFRCQPNNSQEKASTSLLTSHRETNCVQSRA
ncbi:hypothetical protein BDN71DRAFT_1455002 [Pleurotus eryngii]|uniref:Uncharacterized protein n=1 Tax=Pleurotus eryngii TaxID=5323 RepID=A0A9P5ZME5_PLEER|nr:hypothetical protein BDN71DRAFT_1455002 [Pleurotus eryngii]